MELREVFEPIVKFLKNLQKKDKESASKDFAKERLQLVLMQDRASVSPDFFEMMKKEIIEVIKKYIEIDEEQLEVQLTRGFENGDGTGPALFANIPIKNIKPVAKKIEEKDEDIVDEQIDNSEFVEELSSEENENIVQAAEEDNQELKESEDIQTEEKAENIEVIETASDEKTNVENLNVEAAEETADIEDMVKDKIAEVKEGVAETIEKVKKGAKDGIKKIKTKTQKKKINE
jgi:cell division topological specificity factor